MAVWTFVVTDLNLTPLGELLQASDRTVTINVNKIDSCSFSVRLDNPLADYLAQDQAFIKAYRNQVLQFFGPVISAEETSDETGTARIAVTCASAGWFLTKRYVGRSSTGATLTAGTDKAQAIVGLLATVNGTSDTHIQPNPDPDPAAGTTLAANQVVGPYEYLADTINKLSATLDGFDWRILPRDNWNSGAPTDDPTTIGYFHAQPVIGAVRAGAVFDYGTGRNNIASYSRVMNRDVQANTVYHNVVEGPDAPGFPTVSSSDSDSIDQWGLMEAIADADIHDPTLRKDLTDQHVLFRKQPKQTITFVPHIDHGGTLPDFGVDYDVGDIVTARAIYHGSVRFNVQTRVYAVSFALDEFGTERATLTLVQES